MTDVYYVKLVTGEQLLTGLHDRDDRETVLDNPLELTFNETDDGRSYIFLSRYSPFAAMPRITVRNDHIVHVERAMCDAEIYYERSLRYCVARTDKSFARGVSDANDYVLQLVEDAERPPHAERGDQPDLSDDGVREAIGEIIDGTKKTIH